ncbi:hypothetical protein HOLleu_28336 [Holothuria leucospilota]|uniref:Tyr recombinase domain-containing protein n=1 Tax=Holothuria leucospilota TaxID=206669 RepID=A0A9Q1BLU0_HOLLE|nr:hypothetical protein HOLleu_28336 [Holothuria leucospilota]
MEFHIWPISGFRVRALLRDGSSFVIKDRVVRCTQNVNTVLVFLSEFRDQGLHYSAINIARSALATFTTLSSGNSISTDPLVSRFFKGIFNTYPPMPRYTEIWNVSLVLYYIRGLPPVRELDLKMLSLKLCFLVAITSAQRLQTLHLLQLDQLTLNNDSAIFRVTKFLKQSRPGNVAFEVLLEAYQKDERLCVLKTLIVALFISYKKPYHRVSKDTLSRWIKIILTNAGIDTLKFKAHSTRAAATSAAVLRQVPVSDIHATAGWAGEKKTFEKFYRKPILAGQWANAHCLRRIL